MNNFGGKANSLIKLKNNDIQVPNFFILSSEFYKEFLKQNNISDIISKHLLNNEFDKIKNKIKKAEFSNNMKDEIYNKFDMLNCDEVSVRSSANNEDGNEKSFAGQYDTFLSVKKKDILDKIKSCWCPLYDENVINYTGIHDFDAYAMNVIIQKMINPYCAGVAFSVDTSSSSENYTYIETCIGNGEKLVSGTITPSNYIVRRETSKIDYHKGDNILTEEEINKLEKLILKIEKIYNFPVDVEWCLDNNHNIYILQARPITAFNQVKEPIKKILTREKCLWEIELYYTGEYYGIKKLTNNLYYQNPIFNFISSQKTEIFYNTEPLEEYPNAIFRTLDENYDYFNKCINEIYLICEDVLKILEKKEIDILELIDKLISIQPFSTLGNMAGQGWYISDRIKDKLFKYRENYDYIIYKSEDIIYDYLKENTPSNIHKYLNVLSIDDIRNINNIDIKKLEQRLKGFVYYNGQIINQNFDMFLKENNLYVKEDEKINDDIIKGIAAYSGKIKGIVKIINSKEDFNKFNKGDIIVAPMTTPKYTTIMKIAGGIITDEGGATCHASIVARELKIPCLIGCKNATKVLKDDMEVELDATKGQVKIKQ